MGTFTGGGVGDERRRPHLPGYESTDLLAVYEKGVRFFAEYRNLY